MRLLEMPPSWTGGGTCFNFTPEGCRYRFLYIVLVLVLVLEGKRDSVRGRGRGRTKYHRTSYEIQTH
jgi:hypothetical protein